MSMMATKMTTSTSPRSSSKGALYGSVPSIPELVIGWTCDPLIIRCRGSVVRLAVSTRSVGDFNPERVGAAALERRRREALDLAWSMPAEFHGVDILDVTTPGAHDGAPADGLVTGIDGVALGIWTGDCAGIAIIAPDGRFAVAHAGWRGLALGMVDAVIGSLGDQFRPQDFTAVIGPLIGPCCYEFSRQEAEQVATGVGAPVDQIWYRNQAGKPVLNMREAVGSALVSAGFEPASIMFDRRCTGCEPDLFSHRRRGESERQVLVGWRTTDA